jgi:hypothetical protein
MVLWTLDLSRPIGDTMVIHRADPNVSTPRAASVMSRTGSILLGGSLLALVGGLLGWMVRETWAPAPDLKATEKLVPRVRGGTGGADSLRLVGIHFWAARALARRRF